MAAKRKRSLRLVVDASVVRAAGESVHPVSLRCRRCLSLILEISHRIVLSQKLYEEWKKHISRYSRSWLVSMYARKKVLIDSAIGEVVRPQVENCDWSEQDQEAILKDAHLIDSALRHDKIVFSLDNSARNLLPRLVALIPAIEELAWVNPVEFDDANFFEV